jgi:hypothetical protein
MLARTIIAHSGEAILMLNNKKKSGFAGVLPCKQGDWVDGVARPRLSYYPKVSKIM